MAYCDSKKLEADWFEWIVASATPSLELYRKSGILWTKIIGKTERNLLDPNNPVRLHYIDIGQGVFCKTEKDSVSEISITNGQHTELPLDFPFSMQVQQIGIGRTNTDLVSANGYIKENPTQDSWHRVLSSVDQICKGISKKFTLPTEEHREELAHDAFLQVVNKLKAKKLIYTPGRAPVFNLLTTTIYRCMYSTLNKSNKTQRNLQKLVDGVASGMIRHSSGSFQCPVT